MLSLQTLNLIKVFTTVGEVNCLVQMMSFHIGDKFHDITNISRPN